MKIRGLSGLVVLFVLVAAATFAFDGVNPSHKHFGMQNRVFNVVSQYWSVQELFFQMSTNPTPGNLEAYEKAAEIYAKQSTELGKIILDQLEEPNRECLRLIGDIYKSLDPMARPALYPSLATLKREVTMELKAPLTDKEFREYFPGYGYTEPGYKYRKGREVERENKGTTWQSEEHSITSTFSVELTVTLDILNILKGMLTGGVIKNLVVKDQYETNVGGTPMIVCKVSFQVIKAIVTKTNRKFEVNKIWFELLRAKASGYQNPTNWEVCGKTYEIINEPTGEEVVTQLKES